MNSVKTITTTAAFVLTLSGYALAQRTLGDSGSGGAVDAAPSAVNRAPSAVNRAPSAVNRVPSAVNSAPSAVESSGSGGGSSSRSSNATQSGNTSGVDGILER